jgi:hypothetical protein
VEILPLAGLHSRLANCIIRMMVQTTTVMTISVIITRLLYAISKREVHGAVNRRRVLQDANAEHWRHRGGAGHCRRSTAAVIDAIWGKNLTDGNAEGPLERNRLHRGTKRGDRIPLGGGPP